MIVFFNVEAGNLPESSHEIARKMRHRYKKHFIWSKLQRRCTETYLLNLASQKNMGEYDVALVISDKPIKTTTYPSSNLAHTSGHYNPAPKDPPPRKNNLR
jgi:hypothetical protein